MQTKVESNEQYHSNTNISASGLKTIFKKSVYHYLNQKPFSSSSLELGSAIHTRVGCSQENVICRDS